MKNITIILITLCSHSLFSQGNCLIYPEGSGERKACKLSYKALEHAQGSKESQMLFDSAILAGPNYAWAYYEKSVPYFKRGFLYEGLQLLNKAIELAPLDYLPYRASWMWGYKNYDLCVQDLEKYYALPNAYPQFTPGGEKNMKVVLGLAYAKFGDFEKAIQTIEDYMDNYANEHEIGFSDYHTLGMLYVHNKQYDKAIKSFEKQFTIVEEIADSYYYLGLVYKAKSDFEAANIQFQKALLVLQNPSRYRNAMAGFPVYKLDIEKEIESLKGLKKSTGKK